MIYNFWNLSKTSYLYENLNEGLIKSYDLHDIKNTIYLILKYDAIKDVIKIYENPYYSKSKKYSKDEFVRIYLKDDIKSLLSYEKIISICYNLYGWFSGIIEVNIKTKNGYKPTIFYRGEPYKNKKLNEYKNCFYAENINDEIRAFILKNQNNIHSVAILIEQKFPIQEYIYNLNDAIFYHLTDKTHLDKILKHGLVPKSNFNYPSRIYLSNNKNDLLDDFELNINNKVILTLQFKNIKKIYRDPRSNGFLHMKIFHQMK